MGEAVQAMVLHALGVVSRPLYLTPAFFTNKPLDRLVRSGVTAEMRNDDSLGRALDIRYAAGPTDVFAQVASHALRLWGIPHRCVHLDTTSLRVAGEDAGPAAPGVVPITHGYSRDGRPDVQQGVVALLTRYRSALPLWIQALDGHASDPHTFPHVVEADSAHLPEGAMPSLVAESARSSADHRQRLAGVRWLTRVPERIGLAHALIEEITAQEMRPAGQEGYRSLEVCTTYGGVRQRWLIVWLEQAERRERATLQKRVSQEREEADQAWKSLVRHEFPSQEAAEEAVGRLTGTWVYHQAEMRYRPVTHDSQSGRPRPGAVPQRVGWRLEGDVGERSEAIAQAERGLGTFILATNDLNEARLPAEEMRLADKGQGGGPERGVRFLKDPWFCADSLFLNSPKRMMALGMVMGLALLVSALAEHKVRTTLQEQGESVPNQAGKPTQRPTMRRIFQMFEGIDLLVIKTPEGVHQQVLNLKPVHRQILRLLGPNVEKCYLDSS